MQAFFAWSVRQAHAANLRLYKPFKMQSESSSNKSMSVTC